MDALLKFSRLVDALNERFGLVANWLVLIACAISAGNALMRYGFSLSSNAWLEIQWYLFAGVFMLGVGYVLLVNGHVRIDVISSRLSKRTNTVIDALGMVLFTIPLAVLMIYLSWPLFMHAYDSGEMSQNAGGLLRWPVLLLMPVGFAILLAQCISELIKRVAYLTGHRAEPMSVEHEKSPEELLLEGLVVDVPPVQKDVR
jgi:TRAP-type mannitol/chloroaromatic compound transport system permease small subunit